MNRNAAPKTRAALSSPPALVGSHDIAHSCMRFTSRYETMDCSDRSIAASAVGPSFGAHVFIRSSARLACYAGQPTCAQAWIGTCDVANSASTYAHAQGGLHHRPDHLRYCPRPLNDFSRTVLRFAKARVGNGQHFCRFRRRCDAHLLGSMQAVAWLGEERRNVARALPAFDLPAFEGRLIV